MQTITHLPIGALLGAVLFPHQPIAQAVCAFGAIAPDLVIVPAFLADKVAGRDPLRKHPRYLTLLKNPTHSFFVWCALALLGLWAGYPILTAFGIGGVSHVLIDVATHGDPKINYQDPVYFWPLKAKVHIGTWDYRIEHGLLWPLKPPEQLVICLAAGGTLLTWLIQ